MTRRRTRNKELVVLGYYGAGNFGDDLMLKGLLNELLAADAQVRVHVVSYHHRPVPLPNSDRVHLVRVHNPLLKVLRLAPIFASARLAVFGGGTPFTDTEGDGSYKFFRLAQLMGCAFGYVGIGVGRVSKQERRARARWLMEHCKLLLFRDAESLRSAQGIADVRRNAHVAVTEDLAYLAVQPYATLRRDRVPAHFRKAVLSWRKLEGEEGAARADRLAAQCVRAFEALASQSKLAELILLPLDLTADGPAHAALQEQLQRALPRVAVTIACAPDTDAVVAIVSEADLYVSVRLHGGFIGKVLGVPTVGFAYSPKVEYFFRSIGASSYLSWEQFEADHRALLTAADRAQAEATRRVDLAGKVMHARENIAGIVRALE